MRECICACVCVYLPIHDQLVLIESSSCCQVLNQTSESMIKEDVRPHTVLDQSRGTTDKSSVCVCACLLCLNSLATLIFFSISSGHFYFNLTVVSHSCLAVAETSIEAVRLSSAPEYTIKFCRLVVRNMPIRRRRRLTSLNICCALLYIS